MRIGIFSDCYFPAINGVVTSIHQQLEVLRDLGHEVEIYCPQYKTASEEEGVFRLWARPFVFHKREQFTLPWPPSVVKRIWTRNFDLVHIQTPFSVGLLGMVSALARGIPRVFHHHTLWEEYVDYIPIPRWITVNGSIALCKSVANLCHMVISPSEDVLTRFSEQGVRTPMSVIPTGISPARFRNGRELPQKLEGEEVCLYMGRLAHEKSLDSLIRVFHRIHQARPSTRLWLVGDGPAREALEAQVRSLGLGEVTRFFGFVERETLRDYVASARLFIFTSLTETQGLVLLEAQAGGLPVIAYRASGVSEAVDSGGSGFLVESGQEELLAQSGVKLLEDDALWNRFSGRARQWSENFSVERMGEALVCTYEKARKRAQNREK